MIEFETVGVLLKSQWYVLHNLLKKQSEGRLQLTLITNTNTKNKENNHAQ